MVEFLLEHVFRSDAIGAILTGSVTFCRRRCCCVSLLAATLCGRWGQDSFLLELNACSIIRLWGSETWFQRERCSRPGVMPLGCVCACSLSGIWACLQCRASPRRPCGIRSWRRSVTLHGVYLPSAAAR